MNSLLIMQILISLPTLVQAIEAAFSEQGKGQDKLAAILQAVLVMVPQDKTSEFLQKTWPNIAAYVTVLVYFYNHTGFFKSLSLERKPS